MQYPANSDLTAWRYYFRWQGTRQHVERHTWTSTSATTDGPAPDGDEYFAAALYLADRRWGSAGTVNYQQEADNIANAMLHNTASADGRTRIIQRDARTWWCSSRYGDSANFSDPSYHLPAFYELFALDGPAADAAPLAPIARHEPQLPRRVGAPRRPGCTPTTPTSTARRDTGRRATATISSATTPGAWS